MRNGETGSLSFSPCTDFFRRRLSPWRERTFTGVFRSETSAGEFFRPSRDVTGTPLCRLFGRQHAQCVQIEIKHRLLLFALMAVLLANGNDFAQDLGIEPVGFGLRIDFLDVASDNLFLFLQSLDTLDEALEL